MPFPHCLPREEISIIILQSFCREQALGVHQLLWRSQFTLSTHQPSTASPGPWNQLTDWRALRARMSLSSQLTLSLWTRVAICCSISNLKGTKGKKKSFWSQRAHHSWKTTPARKERQPHAKACVPVSIQGLIAEANAGVDQRGTTMNGQEILVGI